MRWTSLPLGDAGLLVRPTNRLAYGGFGFVVWTRE